MHKRTKKFSFQRYLISFSTLALGSMPFTSYVFAGNEFVDIPLNLQSTTTTTSSYSVKPNIVLLIDDSGSMNESNEPESFKCKKRTRQKISDNKWSGWTGWSSDYVANFDTKPPKATNQESEEYGDCKNTTKMDITKEVLTSILQKYRNDFYFMLQPFNHYESKNLDKFYDTANDDNYQFLLHQINGNKDPQNSIQGLHPSGGTPTTKRYTSVVRNMVMNKLQYRCQSSYIVLMSDGEANNSWPWTDSITYGNKHDFGYRDRYDGYFDAYRDQNIKYCYKDHDNNEMCQSGFQDLYKDKNIRLSYYANTVATKSFSEPKENGKIYIYQEDYRDEDTGARPRNVKKRLTDNAGRPWNDWKDPNDHSKGRFTQTATTFTIGVGLGTNLDAPAAVYLREGATVANPDSTQTDGVYKDQHDKPYDAFATDSENRQLAKIISPEPKNFFNANSRQEIIDAFSKVFENIKGEVDEIQKPITTNAPSVGVSSTNDLGNIIVRASVDTATWSSMLHIYGKNKGTYSTPTFGNRQLILSDGSNNYLYPNHLDKLDNDYFHIPNNGKNGDEWKNGLLAWLARAKPDSQIQNSNYVLDYRTRSTTARGESSRNMGDIIDNNIFSISKQRNTNPEYLLTSTNDGMVYVFKATKQDDINSFDLKFNYLPLNIQRLSTGDVDNNSDTNTKYLQDLTANDYGQSTKKPHRFLLNGGMAAINTGGEKPLIFMASTMGLGGRGVFALKIGGYDPISGEAVGLDKSDNMENLYKDITLFHSPQDKENKFGYTIGAPAIARIRNNPEEEGKTSSLKKGIRYAVFASSGFHYPDAVNAADANNASKDPTETALYIYDALGLDVGTEKLGRTGDTQGTLIRKIIVDGGVGGLAAPQVYDMNNDGIADVAYAGDYGGNMYRFDLRNPNPERWSVVKIYEADSNDHAPITSAPIVYQYQRNENIVIFGTGSEIYQSDLESKDEQYVFGIYDNLDNPKPEAKKKSSGSNTNTSNTDTKNHLLEQKLDGSPRDISNQKFSDATGRQGWYFALSLPGERVVITPQIVASTLILQTHTFETQIHEEEDPCIRTQSSKNSQRENYMIQVNALTGGKLSNSDFRLSQDGVFNTVTRNDGTFTIMSQENGNLSTRIYDDPSAADDFTTYRHCLNAPPIVISSEDKETDNVTTQGGYCSVTLRHLSWREVYTDYTSP